VSSGSGKKSGSKKAGAAVEEKTAWFRSRLFWAGAFAGVVVGGLFTGAMRAHHVATPKPALTPYQEAGVAWAKLHRADVVRMNKLFSQLGEDSSRALLAQHNNDAAGESAALSSMQGHCAALGTLAQGALAKNPQNLDPAWVASYVPGVGVLQAGAGECVGQDWAKNGNSASSSIAVYSISSGVYVVNHQWNLAAKGQS